MADESTQQAKMSERNERNHTMFNTKSERKCMRIKKSGPANAQGRK